MAYAAVISLKQTIYRLLDSSHISISSPTLQILESANENIESLQEFFRRLDDESSSSSKTSNVLEKRIRETVQKLADSLEFHVSDHYLSLSEEILPLNLVEIRQDFISFAETAEKIKEDYVQESHDPSLDKKDEEVGSSITDFDVKMVGFSDVMEELRNHICPIIRPDDFAVYAVVGKAGTGRTILARTIFDDLCINNEQLFDCGAWVTIGPKYQPHEILVTLLSQTDDVDGSLLIPQDVGELSERLRMSLKGRRYMIVLDDLRSALWDHLRRSFPRQNNGSIILLTTSFKDVALSADSYGISELRTLDDDIIWDYIYLNMFVVNSSPVELEEAGRKIAKNCRGRRLSLIKAVLFLCKCEKTMECWNEIAEDEDNSVFAVEDELAEMRKIKEHLELCNLFPYEDRRRITIKAVTKLLQLSDEIQAIKISMFPERFLPNLEIASFFGMAGIGKTRLVKEIFNDPAILQHFDHRAWVTLGPKYQPSEILIDILAQVYNEIDKLQIKGDEKLAKDLCEALQDKRCLIVFDDLWNEEALLYLKMVFPNIKG